MTRKRGSLNRKSGRTKRELEKKEPEKAPMMKARKLPEVVIHKVAKK